MLILKVYIIPELEYLSGTYVMYKRCLMQHRVREVNLNKYYVLHQRSCVVKEGQRY